MLKINKSKNLEKINSSLKDIEIRLKKIKLSEEDWKNFIEKFTYNTNAIEGSKLTLKQVKKILNKKELGDYKKEKM